jgi:hypothetical protein
MMPIATIILFSGVAVRSYSTPIFAAFATPFNG